jgi:GMP synthase (glutamine-hydrolysing)
LVRVLAVNNYPTAERFERLVKGVEGNGARVTRTEWSKSTAKVFDMFDGVVLSGSPDMMSDPKVHAKFSQEISAIRDSRVPVLGVCFGHQMLAHAFGAQVVKDSRPVLGFVKTKVLRNGEIFEGLPKSVMLLESRHEVVKSLPEGFELTASSETSPIAGMKHKSRPLYGVQSHPERYSAENPEGNLVLGNFVRLIA